MEERTRANFEFPAFEVIPGLPSFMRSISARRGIEDQAVEAGRRPLQPLARETLDLAVSTFGNWLPGTVRHEEKSGNTTHETSAE